MQPEYVTDKNRDGLIILQSLRTRILGEKAHLNKKTVVVDVR
jgi:hypothetical protein